MFAKETYIQRRALLKKNIGSGVLLFLGNDEQGLHYEDNTFRYRQDSTFLYYFGLSFAGLSAIIDLDGDKEIIFGDELTIDHIVWMGTQPTLKEKSERVGITDVMPSSDIADYLHKAVRKGQTVHYLPPYRAEHKLKLMDWLGIPPARQEGSVPFIRAIVAQRSYKSAEEIEESIRPSIPASLKEGRYQICAHRGYWKEAPENSIQAIEKAILNKIDYIEIDVRMTKDGKLVLMHNSTINEVTNGTGKVSELTYDEITSFYMYHGTELTTERVPLLSEALMSARGKIYVDIDMKISDYRAVYEVVKKCGMLSQSMFTVYEVPNAAKLVNIDKGVNVFPVIYSMEELEQYMALVKNLSIVQFNPRTWKDEILNKAYDNGIAGFMNVYINSDETPIKDNYRKVDEFVKLRGTVVQTDFPVELKMYLDKLNKK